MLCLVMLWDLILLHLYLLSPDRVGAKPWDTIKPLRKWFDEANRVILFDDDSWKAANGEQKNMVVIPCWDHSKQDDNTLEHMIEVILSVLGDLPSDADVRDHTHTLSESIMKNFKVKEESAIVPLGAVKSDQGLPACEAGLGGVVEVPQVASAPALGVDNITY